MPNHENDNLSNNSSKETSSDTALTSSVKTTALIHVHGIGQQERFHESSRITDALKKWWKLNLKHDFNFDVKYEMSHKSLQLREALPYFEIKVKHGSQQHIIHVYEVYWAPLAGRGPSDISILFWLMSKILIPVKRVLSNWNQYHYVKSDILQHMHREQLSVHNKIVKEKEACELLELYDFFVDSEKHSYGAKFNDFVELIKASNMINTDRLISIAHTWRIKYITREIGVFVIVLGICLSLLGFILIAVVFLFEILNLFNLNRPSFIPEKTNLLSIVSPLLILIYILFIRRYLREWLGDVKIWVTYQETANNYEIRQSILKQAKTIFSHVIQKHTGLNKKVIVLGHSLGSAIAYETLISLAQEKLTNDSSNLDLSKITHLFTYGSPIDKIHYFFEARSMKENTKSSVLRQIREKPIKHLLNQSKSKLEWLNFYDYGDAIGGPLETPRLPYQMSPIENIYTPNDYFPTIMTNHAEYINNNHMLTYLWHALVPSLKVDKVQQKCNMEPKEISNHLSLMYMGQVAMLIMLYASGLGMIAFFIEKPTDGDFSFNFTRLFLIIGLIAFLVCLAGFLFSFIKKHPDPISDKPNKFKFF